MNPPAPQITDEAGLGFKIKNKQNRARGHRTHLNTGLAVKGDDSTLGAAQLVNARQDWI